MLRWVLPLVLLTSCALEVDFAASTYRCDDGVCPDGFTCSAAMMCERAGGEPDAGPDDASAGADALVPLDGPTGDDAPPAPGCRNGTLDPGEDCDDGNGVDTDACRNSCRLAACGDGATRTDVEECDDGNLVDGDSCSSTCQLCQGGVTDDTTGHCFRWGATAAGWHEGVDACAGMGGYLASLTTASELVFARLNAPAVPYWTGLNDIASEGTYVWYDGEPQLGAAIPWSGNQPNGGNDNNDCVWAEGSSGTFNDLGCTSSTLARPLCEIDGWIVRPDDAHAYRFVFASGVAADQEAACGALGGHLAIIDDTAEASFLSDFATGSFWIGPVGSSCKKLTLSASSVGTAIATCGTSLFAVCEIAE